MNAVVPVASCPVPDARGTNLFTEDPAFDALLRVYMPGELYAHLRPVFQKLGADAGDWLDRLAASADRNPPVLSARRRDGEDLDTLIKHPDYVTMEHVAFSELGLAAMSYRSGVLGWQEPLPPIAKYALTFLFVQAEFGLCCPVSMTDSLTHTLRKYGDAELVARFLPSLTSLDVDKLFQGAMFMTERAAGSDVGRVETRAWQQGGQWRLSGEKWFCSNVDAELAMVLARPDGAPEGIKGIGLFLLPRTLADGRRNHYRIVRLKDKMGTRSMASGEIRLEGAIAYPVGDLTNGFKQMADMINMSRLSNGVRSAGLMRRAYSEARHVAENRVAFGKRLIELPLLRRQLLKILVPGEQARSMFMHIAIVFAKAEAGEAPAIKLLRILTPLIKFRACRDARKATGDAMEIRGGCGYIEEWVDPRLVRDAHLGSIWEGASSVVALDVLRAQRRNGALPVLQGHLRELLDAPDLPDTSAALLGSVLDRVVRLAERASENGKDALARQAASALYNISSAIVMAWEAAQQAPDWRRLALAHCVLRYRLLPVDPLDPGDTAAADALAEALLSNVSISRELAQGIAPPVAASREPAGRVPASA